MVRTDIRPNKGDGMSEMNVRVWTLSLLCGSLKIMQKPLVQDILVP